MDPFACLDSAQLAFDDDDYTQALGLLADYFEWRLKGGFQPDGGDEKALKLQRLTCDTLDMDHPRVTVE